MFYNRLKITKIMYSKFDYIKMDSQYYFYLKCVWLIFLLDY